MTGDFDGRQARPGQRFRLALWGSALLLLLLPLIAMRFSDEVNWTGADFAVFAAMLVAAGGTFEFVVRLNGHPAYRGAAGIALATVFLLTWLNLAVGIIGTEDHSANLLFGGVVLTGIVGACFARGRARGMARALEATALAQVLVAMIAWFSGMGDIFILTGLFVALWLTSAWLFRKAARDIVQGGT